MLDNNSRNIQLCDQAMVVHVPDLIISGNVGALRKSTASSTMRTYGVVSETPSVRSSRIHGGQLSCLKKDNAAVRLLTHSI